MYWLKVTNVPLHQNLNPVESILASLFKRLLIGPVIVVDPVARDYQACAIVAGPSMDKNGRVRRVLQHRQQPPNLPWLWRKDAGEADADVIHARGFALFALPGLVERAATQIEHSLLMPICFRSA